ncbi:hypothetical protein EV356DRAFT_30716 [Viridothelium virens]|uniref:Uncharacterized protein n=1 Tax=Viridothelium virens TaxID=1048519 RepID=A0A6A6HHE6_VIRVR|nr:hypothetical protein EV356DRAFT_30716 [Viridothelium virens]
MSLDFEAIARPHIDLRYLQSFFVDTVNVDANIPSSGRLLLREYSCIPDARISSHVARVQQEAYKVYPYPCIGMLRFLLCTLSEHPAYSQVRSLVVEHDARFLDLGCCFGQDISRLAFDGANTKNCIGVDLESGYFDLAYKLFDDGPDSRGNLKSMPPNGYQFRARFQAADVLNDHAKIWSELKESMDIVHTGSFFHLFDAAKQKRAVSRVVELLNPKKGTMVVGLNLGTTSKEPCKIPVVSEIEPALCHSPQSWRQFWQEAIREAGLMHEIEFLVKVKPMPEYLRIGLLKDPKLQEMQWSLKIV